jgi:transposase
MNEIPSFLTERVDDIPLLLHQMQHLGLAQLIDTHLLPHGNRQGISYGELACVWLTHILSQADHRMNHVRGWAKSRSQTLQAWLPQPLQETDCTDDRLADLLRALSNDDDWEALQTDLNQRTLAVYDLPTKVVRLDATTVMVDTQPEGLFLCGHSKDHRPDVPQVKIMMATLDPLALPLVAQILPGNSADDPLYLPAVEQVRKSINKRGLLYVGDCKMAAKDTRAGIASGEDFYLCPLSAVQMPPEEIALHLKAVLEGRQALENIKQPGQLDQEKLLAQGYEWTQPQQADCFCWQERRLLIRSVAFAEAAERKLDARLAKAQQQLSTLMVPGKGKRTPCDLICAQAAVDAILSHQKVEGLITVTLQAQTSERSIRGYGGKPDRVEQDQQITLLSEINAEAVEDAKALLGWRVFVTNAAPEQLSLSGAVLLYREEYRIEHGFARLKGHPLSLSPVYVSREDHAKGLIRLLVLGLRILTLLEFVVRRALEQDAQPLVGLYAGNPKRATLMPTAELLLEAFKDITLLMLPHSGQHLRSLTPLTPLQYRILELLGTSSEVYTRLLDASNLAVQQCVAPHETGI